ncbi:unnamed protein product [Adineta steineri]|uniref:DUF4590 domain-containing protein n=1 Tax=Adineta steineri TaxID=433720 RepID=A0A813U8S3_9BILA|nr:unnamed protein product [Adineta steineri]CAF3697282.1 unnamed protein product [Adineta steineri]
MDSARLTRRKPKTPRSSAISNNKITLDPIKPIQGTWRQLQLELAKKRMGSSKPSETLISRSLLDFSETHVDTSEMGLSRMHRQFSSENNIDALGVNRHRISSHKIGFIYPQSIVIGPNNLYKSWSCQITMSYRFDPTLPPVLQNSRRDEVTIFQVVNNGFSWIVFKGFLKMNDTFTFKSQRSRDDRFCLRLEINGSLDTTISACCEHPYRHGGRIDDGDSSFWIKTVEKYVSCTKCKESVDLPLEELDDEKMSVDSSTMSEESEVEEDQPVDKSLTTSTQVLEISKKKVEPSEPSTDHKIIPQKDKSDDDESTLLKYIIDSMQQALSKPKSSKTIPSRSSGNLENFTILYIDQNKVQDLNLLRSTVNFIRTLNDLNTLQTLLTTIIDERVIVITTLDRAQTILPELQQHKCIQFIYLLSKEMHSPKWINNYNKIIRIYPDITSIHDHLIKTLADVSSRMIPMEITSKESTTDLEFTYCQLLKETILCQDDESDLKKDMLTFCRLHYTNNQEELDQIDNFEKSFIETESIQWYTRHCFLSKILSRAFRTQEIDLLFKMRYFIQSLHKQIQSIANKEPITIYTILDAGQETIEKFQDNINGLVIFHSFLPATLKRPCQTNDKQQCLVFSIRLASNCAANIDQLRSSDCKIDVLINLNTIFRIVSIDKETNTVNLESVSQDDSHFQRLTEPLRKEITQAVVILQISKLLLETNHYWECDYLTELIYQDKSFENDGTLLASLAASHHLLGNANVMNKDNEGARYQFFKSLRAFHLFLPPYHSMLSSSYNNIGSMFYQDDHHESAIKFHEIALQCQLKASNPDMNAVATYSSNIGAVYIDQKNYTEAIKYLKRAVIIREKMSMDGDTRPLISLFQKISSCFWHIGNAKEALDYYKKTLKLQLELPNPLPHPLSVTYYNLSTAYARLGEYKDAVDCAEKSVEYLKMVPEKHLELKENQAQLEIVRQKLWLKQVLSV